MNNKIVVIKLYDEIYLFKSEHVTSEQRRIIESIVEAMWYDNEDDVCELDQYELLDWVLEKIKIETGIELESLGIDFEITIKRR